MEIIHDDQLATVAGAGESSVSVDTPLARGQVTTSDYAKCVDTVVDQTAKQYPSTKWFGIFGNDDNEKPRAQATLENMRKVCGLPPA
jgi:hypothetical protein